jgi:hypothetical protein
MGQIWSSLKDDQESNKHTVQSKVIFEVSKPCPIYGVMKIPQIAGNF